MKPCPKCNDNEKGFIVNGFLRGSAESWFDSNGDFEEIVSSDLYWNNSSNIVKCGNCHAIRKDLIFVEGEKGRKIVELTK